LKNLSRMLALLLLAAPLHLLAQTTAPAKPVVKKTTPKVTPERAQLKSEAKNLAAAVVAADQALTPEELAVSERIHVGVLPCELGNSVSVLADPKSPGHFNVQINKLTFRMFPVITSTGAIRLEDQKAGAVWLQLGNKSMLMNAKLGQRLADDCKSPEQIRITAALKTAPAQNLLDPVPPPNLAKPTVADATIVPVEPTVPPAVTATPVVTPVLPASATPLPGR
jgi:hypothetical protein